MRTTWRTTSNGIVIISPDGRFDANESGNVREVLKQTVSTVPAKVIVNLKQVSFIDSSGLAALVEGMMRSKEKKGKLHLCNLQQRVRIIFELARLDRAFEIFADEKSAINAFS